MALLVAKLAIEVVRGASVIKIHIVAELILCCRIILLEFNPL